MDSNLNRAPPVLEPTVWQPGRAADEPREAHGAADRRSAGTASCAPETRGAFPSSLHASQRDSAVLKHLNPPLPLPFLLLLRLFSPHRGSRWKHSSGTTRAGSCLMWPSIHPAEGLLGTNPQVSCKFSVESCTLRKQKRPFPRGMTNQSHYYPINMMEDITFQTRAGSASAQTA